jgi:phosphoglycerate dehydrogenase-like enzyme
MIGGALAFVGASHAASGPGAPPADPEDARVVAKLGLQESDKPVREMVKGWKPPRKIVVSVDTPDRIAWLQSAAPDVKLIPVSRQGAWGTEILSLLGDADAVVGACNEQIVNAGKSLHWIHADSAGVEYCTPLLKPKEGLLLTNMKRVSSLEISDHVIALMFALSRGIDGMMRAQLQQKWVRGAGVAPTRMWEIEGRTMFVAGLGGIGTGAAQKAHALGMRVVATRSSSREGPNFVEYVGLPDETPKLASQADVVVNALPLTQQTKGLFDAAMFTRMKKGAYYISVGRGGTTITKDLIAALKSGQLGGAALDVTDPEPLPPGDPLWSAPNIIISPHCSSYGDSLGGSGDRAWRVRREQIRRYAAGEKIYNMVNIEKGF